MSNTPKQFHIKHPVQQLHIAYLVQCTYLLMPQAFPLPPSRNESLRSRNAQFGHPAPALTPHKRPCKSESGLNHSLDNSITHLIRINRDLLLAPIKLVLSYNGHHFLNLVKF